MFLLREHTESSLEDIGRIFGNRDHMRDLIARVNACRRENKALQSNANLRFQKVDNDQIIAFTKATDDGSNQVLVVVNLDPHHAQAGILELELERLGVGTRYNIWAEAGDIAGLSPDFKAVGTNDAPSTAGRLAAFPVRPTCP